MPATTPFTRRAAAVGLTALVLSLPTAPALAQDALVDPVTGSVTALLSPSPSASPLVPVPDPVKEVVDALTEEVEEVAGPAPAPAPAPAPVPAAPAPAAPAPAPAPVTGQGSAPRQVTPASPAGATAGASVGGTGAASLGALSGVPGLRAGTGSSSVPALGAPMIAAAPGFTLPGLAPQTAPEGVVAAAPRPLSPASAPEGLPALVVAVAVVALIGAGAGQVNELRLRRATSGS